jgi:hypothetical protein
LKIGRHSFDLLGIASRKLRLGLVKHQVTYAFHAQGAQVIAKYFRYK